MIVLKHLARAVNLTPFKTRTVLRELYGPAPGKRWKWQSEQDKKYLAVLANVRKHLGIRDPGISGKSNTAGASTSPSSPKTTSSSHKEAGK